jgi:guanine deaminase
MLDRGLPVALGSDTAGGALLFMPRVITAALRTSKAKRIESNWQTPFLTVAEAYYLATTAGAKYFGGGPGFAPGDMLHAVVINEEGFPPAKGLSISQRFERALYLAEERHIETVYANGKRTQ